MKKAKKYIIASISILFVIGVSLFVYFTFIYDKNKLSIREKEWLSNNSKNVISFGVTPGINVFSKDGVGVFYDFIDDFANQYELNIDKTVSNNSSSLGFVFSDKQVNEDLLFYKDYYVVVSKDYKVVNNINDLKDGVLSGLSDSVSKLTTYTSYTGNVNIVDTRDNLLSNLENDTSKYIFVPLNEYLDVIIENNYSIVYQFENIPVYYYLSLSQDKTLNSILVKFYNKWKKDKLDDNYYKYLFNLYVDELELTDLNIQSFTSKTYTFGFVNKAPLQIINGSKFGGITKTYLDKFSKLTNTEFDFISYKTSDDMLKAFNNNKLDLIFNDSSAQSNVLTNMKEEFFIISPIEVSNQFFADINQIGDSEVCAINGTSLSDYLTSFENIKLKLVNNEKKLFNCTRKKSLIAIDKLSYDYYKNDEIKDYYIAYSGYNKNNYNFKYVNSEDSFYKVFSSFINIIGYNDMIAAGTGDYEKVIGNGAIFATIAKYVLIIAGASVLVVGIVIASKKRVKLNTKIKKDEKLKFVDMMTSLKNRNYLNEKMEVWNQNTIYPQAIIVIDLNNVKYLNDTFGHEEGDKQIMAAANVLHQNQVDNSEIMRTDGNEFMIYMVGYSEKQVVNYIKKLLKEFNNLPYDYGVAIGFSMIVDDLKLIDDAINEATILMRENKEIEYNESES